MTKYKLERKSFKQIVGNILVIASLIPIGAGGYSIYRIINRNNDAITQTTAIENTINNEYEETTNQIFEETEEIEEEHISKYNFEELRKINPNIIGIIEGDCFANGFYPVVSSTSYDDLNQKLYEDLEGNYSTAGLIIADPNNDENLDGIIRIWGHHFADEEDTGLMFSSIVNYDSEEYTKQHPTLKFYTENGEYTLEVFASTKENPMNEPLGKQTEEEFSQNINDIKSKSMIQTNIEPKAENGIIILTTCPREGSAIAGDNRISVYLAKTPVWEKKQVHSKSI